MPNKRDPNKTKVNMWLTNEEKALLTKEAQKRGYDSLTEFVKAVARGAVKVDAKTKALALAFMGQQGWLRWPDSRPALRGGSLDLRRRSTLCVI